MATYPFLSEPWLDEARRIREEYRGRTVLPAHALKMNLVIVEVPFGEATMAAHVDTSTGEMELETGHLPDVDLTVTVEYETAKALLIEGNPQAGMQAFMSGRIKVEGDVSKLLLLQSGISPTDPTAAELAARIQGITE